MGLDSILGSDGGTGPAVAISARDPVGDATTLASMSEALVGLPAEPEFRREATGTYVERHGDETVDGVRGGRRLPDLDL